jgi:DNA-binding Lrp family transcriptional regulator
MTEIPNLDAADRKLLHLLQSDSKKTAEELGEALGLSPSQAARRKQRLEADEVITGYRATLSPSQIGLTVEAFIQVQMREHGKLNADAFARLIQIRPEILNAWTMTGEADYLLRVYCRDLAELNTLIHEVILPHETVARVQSQIVMNQLKTEAPLPT